MLKIVRVFLSRKEPLRNKKGETVGIIGVSIDITEQKRAQELEKQLLVEHAQTSQIMAGSIAHELRTPIMSILMGVRGVKKFFMRLVKAYRLAQQHELLESEDQIPPALLDNFLVL